MIEQPRRGLRVHFKPPEMAYSASSRQAQVSGLDGILEEWNGFQAKVRFFVNPRNVLVNVNVDYLYAEDAAHDTASPDDLFRK